MGFGGSSPPEYKAPTTYLGNMRQVRSDNPFAYTQSTFSHARGANGKTLRGPNSIALSTVTRPKEFIQQGIDTAGNVMNQNLSYLQQDPNQRFASITGGNDLYYNVLADQLASAERQALGRAKLFGQSRGLTNSTTQGAAVGKIMDDSLKREREAQLAAFNLGQQTATGNVGTGLGVLSGINNIISPQATQTASMLGNLRTTGEQINQENAMREYQSAMAQYQQQQANQAAWGKALGMVSPVGGAIYSGITGNPQGALSGATTFSNMFGAAMPMLTGSAGGSTLGANPMSAQWNQSVYGDPFGGKPQGGFY